MRYDAGEVITAMVTPFNEKREVDYEKVESLAYQLINTGSDAVLVTGTTGEFLQVLKELFKTMPRLLWEQVPIQPKQLF